MNASKEISISPTSSLLTAEDATLVHAFKNGDTLAFERIMRRYNQRLFRVARSILRNETEAEDAVQEAWLRAFTHMDHLLDSSRLGGWLSRIAANESLDRLRSRGPGLPENAEALMERNKAPGAVAALPTPDAEERRREARTFIEQAVDRLPEHYRVVFVLRAIEELSVEETALILLIPSETVKSRFHRANRALRKELSGVLESTLPDVFGFDGPRCDRIVSNVLQRLNKASGRLPHPPD